MQEKQYFAGIEAGGTKFVCGIAASDGRLIDQRRIDTTTPGDTLGAVDRFLSEAMAKHGRLAAIGVGSFGPLSLMPEAPDYGAISGTPKPGWNDTDMVRRFEAYGVPVAIDTDVAWAAVGERLFGSAQNLDDFCYITIGTGIGVGVMIGGMPHHGRNHPEAGHIPMARAPGDTAFAGICPYHGDCLEGLASGPAMQVRWGRPADELGADHIGWGHEADYIASLCASLTWIVQPMRIVIGGGVGGAPEFLPKVRVALAKKLGGYGATAAAIDTEHYIAPATAGTSAGLNGAFAAAFHAVHNEWPIWDRAPA